MKLSDFAFTITPSAQPACAATSAESDTTAADLLDEALATCAQRVAVQDETKSLTYEELDRFSARLASFLQSLGVGPDSFVGIMTGRNVLFIAAILGTLRAGGAYVPIDPALPRTRRRDMLRDCKATVLLSEAAYLSDLNDLHWDCPDLDHAVCLDSPDFHALCEEPGELMSTQLWDHIAAAGIDDIEIGGWKSPYTGKWLSREVMDGYEANVRTKLAPLLKSSSRVLEIGCASGITMRAVAPLCGQYLGIDLSGQAVMRARLEARNCGLNNVTTRRMRADEIGMLPEGGFDCVIVNSVIESFPGFNYLRQVLDLALDRLGTGGLLFLGNVWDMDKRDAFLSSLRDFARDHAGQGLTTKMDVSNELFAPKDFLSDWAAGKTASGQPVNIVFSDMLADDAELSAYGYDAVVIKGKTGTAARSRKKCWALSDMAGLPDVPPANAAGPASAAYAIFTSGSTGRPKGALVEHRNLVNLIHAIDGAVIAPLSKNGPVNIVLIASFSFDASVQQIFPALAGGHTLHIVPDATRHDPATLHAFLEERSIAFSDGTPSLFHMLLDYWAASGKSSRVKSFILGGERIRPDLPERFFADERHAGSLIFNGYGPTECTVDTTLQPLSAANWKKYPEIPIGRPIPGVEILIVDTAGRMLPTGVAGEILIAGANVGRGYVGQPELTARRFIPHPSKPGVRAYHSGDLGRERPDGAFVFLGRDDGQVKVRGFRIECAEVETALRGLPGVADAVVAAGDYLHDGIDSLAAWVVAAPDASPSVWRDQLRGILPDYMVPSHFIRMDRLPLSSSGKLDRRALPPPVTAEAHIRSGRPPGSETERRLAVIWAELLKLGDIDAEADFFASGGHSILAVRLVSRIEAAFGVRVGLDRLFADASLAAVARMIDQIRDGRSRPEWSPLVSAREEGSLPPLFCFHPVGGNILCYQHLARELGGRQPVHMIQSPGIEEGQKPLGSVEDMAAFYIKAITGRFPDTPLALAGWSFGGLVAFEAARQLTTRGHCVTALVLLDSVAVPDRVIDLLSKDSAGYYATLFGDAMDIDTERLRALDENGQLDFLMEEGLRQGLFPPDIDRSSLGRLLTLFRANGEAAMRYRAQPLDMPALLVRPTGISRAALSLPDDPLQGWGGCATGGVQLAWVPGNHATMLTPPHVKSVAAAIGPYLITNNNKP